MSDLEAAVLAGGLGRRFRPYTEMVPKHMLPLGLSEKPLLEYIVRWLASEGVKKVALLVGYKWRYIYNYFGRGERFNIDISYSIDDDVYKGTGGALLKAFKENVLKGNEALIWYGDILALVPIPKLVEFHFRLKANATLVYSPRYQVPVGVLEERNGIVESVREKPWLPLKTFIGVAIVERDSIVRASGELGYSFDIMGDLIPWMLNRGYRVAAFEYNGPWYDVGSLERYEKIDPDVIEKLERELKLVD